MDMRSIEYRLEMHENGFQPIQRLYVGRRQTPLAISLELIQDAKSGGYSLSHGVGLVDVVITEFKKVINDEILDIHYGLTEQDIKKILKITMEKLQ